MAKVKLLTVFLENQPGRLAAVAEVLADAKVNISALLGTTTETQGWVQIVVDDINKAKKSLRGAQFPYVEGTLEQVELSNRPGALAEFTGELAKNGMNVETVYGTVPAGAKKIVLMFALRKGVGS